VRWSVADTAAGVPVRATASYLSAVFDAQAEAFDDDLHAPCIYHARTMHIPCTYHACHAYTMHVHVRQAEAFDDELERLEYDVPRQAHALLASLHPGRRFRDILDLGCGTGLNAPLWAQACKSLVGLDLSAAMLRCAAARGGYTELLCGDLDALLPNMDPRRFDLVLATDTLIYYGELQP